MLEQPWPPPADGPQQPRDAHGGFWRNDARLRPSRRGDDAAWSDAVLPESAWADLEHAMRRAVDDVFHADDDRQVAPAEPLPAVPDGPGPSATRWDPAEEWIPAPRTAPERAWTPERDWVEAFGRPAPAPPARTVARRRRWLLLAAGVSVALAAGALALVATWGPLVTVGG